MLLVTGCGKWTGRTPPPGPAADLRLQMPKKLPPLPVGPGEVRFEIGSLEIPLYTYKPAGYVTRRGPLVLFFSGSGLGPRQYRDALQPLAERFGALVVVPEFDRGQFPASRYERGGVLKAEGAAPREERTYALVLPLVNAIRAAENRRDLPCYFLGHGAGGQFVQLMAAFAGTETVDGRRMVAVNPGAELFPTQDLPFPYGFGSLPRQLSCDRKLRRYLAQPLTIYLGDGAGQAEPQLDSSPEAMRQGASSLERGRANFTLAQRVAAANGWPFGWRLVIAQGVGHDPAALFNAPEATLALFGPSLPPAAPPR